MIGQVQILRIWLVHPSFSEASAAREGVIRYITNLVKALLQYSNIGIEIWCLDSTKENIQKVFNDACSLSFQIHRIKYISHDEFRITKAINKKKEKNAVLLIPLCGMVYYQGITLKNKVLILMDLFTVVFYELFKIIHQNIDVETEFLLNSIENLRKDGCFFVANSESIIDNHILKYTKITRSDCDFVYLPVPTYSGDIISKEELFTKFNITSEYIIFPTQIRPHKNIEVLLKLLILLRKSNIKLKLLLTGNLQDFPPNYDFAVQNNLLEDIIFTKSVSSLELHSLYSYAFVCIASSFEEGGMPWPIFEALDAKCPVIAADIAVTRERLSYHKLNYQTSGIPVFDPSDAESLLTSILEVIKNRNAILEKQQNAKNQLFSWTWQNVADKYCSIFNKIVAKCDLYQRKNIFYYWNKLFQRK